MRPPKRKGRKKSESPVSRAEALALGRKIKTIRSYVDEGVGWVEILLEGQCELALRFEIAPAVVERSFLVQYRGGNCQLIKRYRIARDYPAGALDG
jgi:hypothetical protein